MLGFGFVTYDNEESVEQVIQRYYDNKIDGKWVRIKRNFSFYILD